MRTIYMLMHKHKPDADGLARRVIDSFARVGISVSAEPWLVQRLGEESGIRAGMPQACDAIVAVGGDGTLLRANEVAVEHAIPLLGVNVGRVGFLAEVELDKLDEACKCLADNRYELDERMMLKAETDGKTMLALNDVVVSRGGYSRLIGINAWVDGDQIGRFIADGLIVSTPTGSTGYSLSAGGPIVCPEVACMLVTPICAHSLQHRPVVTASSQTITIQLDGDYHAMIAADGREPIRFQSGQTLTITRSAQPARFIRLEPRSFFSTIRVKLSEWSQGACNK